MMARLLRSPLPEPSQKPFAGTFIEPLRETGAGEPPPAPPTEPNDAIASWFRAAEDIGEFIGIRFGRLPAGATEPEWTFLRHTDYDGIGGFAELLRSRGANIDRLPQIKHPVSPSWLSLLRELPKFLQPRKRVKWALPPTDYTADGNPKPPPAVAWHVFDETSTVQIRRACRKSGVTVNSFLLKHLTKAIRPFLADQSSVVPWMIPINVRGKVNRKRDTSGHTSYVGVKVRSYETARDVHRNIYDALGRGEHWANWRMYLMGRFMTASMRRLVVASGWGTSQYLIGSFSNLGDWDPECQITQPDCQGPWVFTPLSFRCLHIAAGCVTFQNRLSLAIQVHPCVTSEPAVPQTWIHNWIKEIDIDLASWLERPA